MDNCRNMYNRDVQGEKKMRGEGRDKIAYSNISTVDKRLPNKMNLLACTYILLGIHIVCHHFSVYILCTESG